MEKFGHVLLRLTNAQNSRMLPATIAMSDDVAGSRDQSQINPLFKHFEGRTIIVGRRGPEISSGKGNEPIWKVSIKKRTANR